MADKCETLKTIGTCKDCRFFNRWKWHNSIDPDEGPQLGGDCDLLRKVLGMTNATLHWNKLHVQESFGCIFWQRRES